MDWDLGELVNNSSQLVRGGIYHIARPTAVVVVVVVVLTLTRIIKSVVTGQAPVTLGMRNTPGKTHTKPKVVHAYITADAIHSSNHQKHIKVKSVLTACRTYNVFGLLV